MINGNTNINNTNYDNNNYTNIDNIDNGTNHNTTNNNNNINHTIINSKLIVKTSCFNQHYDIIKDNRMKLCDDVYITLSGWVIKKDIVLFTPRQLNINTNSTITTETRYLIFDYENI